MKQPQGDARIDALYIRGLCESGLEQYDEAILTFQEILAGSPRYTGRDKALYELAWAQQSRGDGDAAARSFERLASEAIDSPLAAESAYRAGELRYEAKEYAKAIEDYDIVRNHADASPEVAELALHKLAWSRFGMQQFDEASVGFGKQIESFPSGTLAADARVMQAECLFQRQMLPEALDSFVELLSQTSPGNSLRGLAYLHAAQAAAQLERWSQGAQLSEQGARELPESTYAQGLLYEQAWARQNLSQTEEALALYERVASADSDELGARATFMIGELQFSQKQYEEAVRSYFRVVYGFGYPDSPAPLHVWQADAMFEAARCLELLQRIDSARRLYAELAERFPDSQHAPTAKEKLAALTEQ
jgi:TolA-binding protein